jgi:mannosyltransferase
MTMVVHPAPEVDAGVDQPPTSWSVPFGAVLVLGVVASIVTVGRASFSLDESVSMTLADASWHRFTQTVLHREANMSLYYLLLRVWTHLGHSEAAVRTLSVLVSVGALAVIMVVARRLFDTRTALVCGLLLAVDPLVVMFAQDARGYALSLLLVSASSALVPLAHAASLAFLPPRSAPWRRIVPAGIGLGLLLVPLALLIHATDSSGVNWAAGSSAGKVFSKVRAEVPHPVIDIAVLLVVGVIVAGVVVIRRHPKTHRLAHQLGAHWSVVFALCWLVVPVAAVVLLSLVYKPLLVVRYLVICLPPFVMLVSYGLARLRIRRAVAAAAAFAVLVAVSLAGLGALFAHGSPQDWRGAVATVADRAAPGDGVVIFAPYTRIPFEWYIHEHPGAETRLRPVFPAGPWAGDPLRYDSSIDVRAAAIEAAVSGYGRIWLVLSQQELYPSQEQALLAGLRSAGLVPADSRTFHGVEVVEYHRGARAV